jgi:hypothetical protein
VRFHTHATPLSDFVKGKMKKVRAQTSLDIQGRESMYIQPVSDALVGADSQADLTCILSDWYGLKDKDGTESGRADA